MQPGYAQTHRQALRAWRRLGTANFVLSFIACFIVVVIAPLERVVRRARLFSYARLEIGAWHKRA